MSKPKKQTQIDPEISYSVGDAARILGVKQGTVITYLKVKNLNGTRVGPKRLWMVPGSELIRKQKETRGRKLLPKAQKALNEERSRADDLAKKNAVTAANQDIGEIPACKNPERRAEAEGSYRRFCEIYFPKIFYRPWSKDLLKVIAKIELVVVHNDQLAIAMPRGSGKTRLCQAAVLWAIFKGIHRYALLIGATSIDAAKALVWFKSELSENDLLFEDFPEVCYPIRKISNESRKCIGQRYKGERTCIGWGKAHIILPKIPGSAASGSVIDVASMEGTVRGRWVRLPDGSIVRPTLVLPDDPQTTESARSQGPESQTEYRVKTIIQDVQGLAGGDRPTAILMPCTVIEKGDLSDQMVDRKKHPEFRGERTKRLYVWPTNTELWEEYREMREYAMQNDLPLDDSVEFYRKHRCPFGRKLDEPGECRGCDDASKCMDCGAVVDDANRLDDPRNLSALQAAMHSFYKLGPRGFAAEMQNEPLLSEIAQRMPTVEDICAKANGYQRGLIPSNAIHTVAFIDPGDYYHTWGACSFAKNFTGSTIDYGTWPEQGLTFSKSNPKMKLDAMYPGAGKKGAMLAGLVALMKQILEKQYQQDGGQGEKIELCLIDSAHFPDEVHSAIRIVKSPIFKPSHGFGINATRTQFVNYKKEKCREMGHHWWVPKDSTTNTIWIDTNYWKTQIHIAIKTMMGDPGSLTFFGEPDDVQLTAAHILAEYYKVPKSEEGIDVQVWFAYPHKDNEILDCLVGCMVAASKLGCSSLPMAPKNNGRPVMSFSQMAKRSA